MWTPPFFANCFVHLFLGWIGGTGARAGPSYFRLTFYKISERAASLLLLDHEGISSTTRYVARSVRGMLF